MKRIFFFILATSVFGITFGQTTTQLFSIADSTVGVSHVTGAPVTATRCVVPGSLSGWHWDGFSDYLLLELRDQYNHNLSSINSGTLAMVDMTNKELKWTRPVNYNSTEVRLQGNYCFLSEKKKNFRIDPETGNVMWENRNEFYFIDPLLGIGIGYPLRSLSNKLTAVDLSNGRELWEKKINRTSGWDDAYMLNDSTLLISVDGISAINLTNGKGWTYKAGTTKKEIGKMIGFNVINIILGLIFDQYALQTQPDVYSEMVSNMLIDPHENTILASKDMISGIDPSGEVVWSSPLPERMTSKSSLFLLDSMIYMINRGYAQYNGGFSLTGEPYFASFDLHSGRQLFLTVLPEVNDFIHNFQVVNDILFLVFENKVATYSIVNGTLITEEVLGLEDGEALDFFAESQIYRKENDHFYKELLSDFSTHNFLMTTEGRVFVLTDDLETVMVYEKQDLYHKITGNGQYALISNNDTDFIVLDNSDIPIGSLKATDNLFLNNEKLCFFDKESFWEVDLHQLYQSPNLWQAIFRNLSKFTPAFN